MSASRVGLNHVTQKRRLAKISGEVRRSELCWFSILYTSPRGSLRELTYWEARLTGRRRFFLFLKGSPHGRTSINMRLRLKPSAMGSMCRWNIRQRPMGVCSPMWRPRAGRTAFACSSSGIRRWCWRPAGGSWATPTPRRTRPRRCSWYCGRRPGRCGGESRSPAGCITLPATSAATSAATPGEHARPGNGTNNRRPK